MSVLICETPRDFTRHVGSTIGPTPWRRIAQSEISQFAALTGDDHWVHVDSERAKRDLPSGRTMAHGIYILSLIPAWQRELFAITRRGAGLSYGYDKVRFIKSVSEGARIRLSQKIAAADPHRLGTRLRLISEVEMDEPDQIAVIAEAILVIGAPIEDQSVVLDVAKNQ